MPLQLQLPGIRTFLDVADLNGVTVEVGDLRQQRQRVVGSDEDEGVSHVQGANDPEDRSVANRVRDDAGIEFGQGTAAATTAAATAGRFLGDGQFSHAVEFDDIRDGAEVDDTANREDRQ